MKSKRVIGFALILSMVMAIVMPFGAVQAETAVAECASYVTTANGEYYTLDLDELFTTGNTYRIAFCVKPSTLAGSKDVFVDVAGGDITVQNSQQQKFGLLYVYDSGAHALGLGDWYNIGSISGYKSSILANGIDFDMVWDTEAGAANIKVTIAEREYTYAWNPGKVTGSYGSFKIGADTTTVTVTDLSVTDQTTADGPTEEPTEAPDGVLLNVPTWTSSDSAKYYSFDLDQLLEADSKYEISFNVKPGTLSGNKDVFVDIAGGDITVQNSQQQKFGLLYVYDSGAHALGLGDWYNIGSISGYKSSILANGIDFRMVWDTGTGAANIKVTIAGMEYTYAWNPGKVTGSYGSFKIGADSATVTLSDLLVKTVQSVPRELVLTEITEEADLHSDPVKAYLADDYENVASYTTGAAADKPKPVTLSWSCDLSEVREFTLRVSESPDATGGWEYTTNALSQKVYNLRNGKTYYFSVTATYLDGTTLTSDISSFSVKAGAPRQIYVPGVANVRDIGGWATENGHTVKDGLVYRSACFEYLNNNKETVVLIRDEGKSVLLDQLGIRSEIDLRYENEGQKTQSILGSGVRFYSCPMNYNGDMLLNNKSAIQAVFGVLADPGNYPVIYHCQAGADRTGVITYLLNGLLGVSKEDLLRDYCITGFAGEDYLRTPDGILDKYVKTLDEYVGDTLADRIYNYLNRVIGISTDDLDSIIEYMGSESNGGGSYEWEDIYTPQNGWTLNDAAETLDGRLQIATSSDRPAIFRPSLEQGKKYEITYDVSNLEIGTSANEWTYQFLVDLTAGEEKASQVLSYRMWTTSGRWNHPSNDALVAEGSNGPNRIVIDTVTGEWEAYALGNLSMSGTFEDVSDFAVCFYRWGGNPASISNVRVTALKQNEIYTPENGWTTGSATEEEDGSLKLIASEEKPAVFRPQLDGDKKYSITYDVIGLETGDSSNEWTYQFLADLSAGEEKTKRVLSYRMASAGRWNSVATDALVAEGTDGENEIVIDMATGEWKAYALGNLSMSGVFENTDGFAISFYRWGGNAPRIANVKVTEVKQGAAKPEIKASGIQFQKYNGEVLPFRSVMPAASQEIVLSFPTKMLLSSLNTDSIVLREADSGAVVPYTVAGKSVSSYRMEFADLLKPNCNYVLTVCDTVANVAGTEIGETLLFPFTTDSGGCEFTVREVRTQGNGTVAVSIAAMNATGSSRDLLLILCYCKGDTLLKACYDRFTADETVRNTVLERLNDFSAPTDADRLKVFLWDGFTTMLSYSGKTVGEASHTSSDPIILDGKYGKPSVPVTVQIFKAGKTMDDIEPQNAADYAVCIGKTVTDENGAYSFTFAYEGDERYADENGIEELNAYLVFNDTGDGERRVIRYVDADTYDDVIDALNTASDFTAFYHTLTKYPFVAGFDSELAQRIDPEAAAKLFYADVKERALDKTDRTSVEKRGTGFLVAEANREKKLDSVLAYAEKLDIPEDLSSDIRFFVKDAASEQRFLSVLSKTNIKTASDLEKALKEAVVLTAVRYPQGYMNLKRITEKYGDVVGIGGKTYPNTKYSKIAGSTAINTLSDLVSELNREESGSGSGGGSGGGSSSGSGGGGSSSGGSSSGSISLPSGGASGKEPGIIFMPFEDLASVEWAHTAIATLADKGIVNGKSATGYYPNDYVTREEFVKLIVLASDTPLDANGGAFSDVPDGTWYAPYVNTGYRRGLCQGMGDGVFGTGLNITRQDAAVMIYRALSSKGSNFPKVQEITFGDEGSISGYAYDPIKTLSGAGIVNGDGNRNFNPQALMTRAEAAQLIYNCLKCF